MSDDDQGDDDATDEDWFERRLRELQHDADTAAGDAGASSKEGSAAIRGPDPTDGEGDWFEPAPDDGDGNTGAGTDSGGGGLFEQDFSAALSDAPDAGGLPRGSEGETPDGLGGAGAAVGDREDPTDFEASGAPDSALDRVDIGIEGLDAMIHGGVPRRSLMVAIGSAGTGKTTMGIQFLEEALASGERAVFIALEESHERVVDSALEKGFPYDEHIEAGRLAVVDIDPVRMANSLRSIRSELPTLIAEFGASRLVLDSVSLLEMMYDDQASRRNEIYDFASALKDAGVTALLTSEASETSPYHSRFGIVEYLSDAVFVLQYVRPSDFQETRLAIEIQKIRDADHSRETKPYEITDEGISVYRQANIF